MTRSFDAYGNPLQDVSHGDYDAPGDEKAMTYAYYPNTSAYIMKPAVTRLWEGASATGATCPTSATFTPPCMLEESIAYYDGATAVTTPPTAVHWSVKVSSHGSHKSLSSSQ